MAAPNLQLCQGDKSQLIIIDVQERLAVSMPKADLDVVTANIIRLIRAATILGIPITITEQYPSGLGPTMGAITAALPPDVKPMEKTCFSTCTADGFEEQLRRNPERKQVVLAGIEAHICVLQTASGLQHWGHQVFVVGDAICSRTPRNRDNGIARMRQGGIQISNAESVAFEWMGDASHKKFKPVAALFK